jgi:hypothetical protein
MMLVSTRTTNILLVLVLAVGIGIVAMLATRSAAGPLDPPAAPGSTAGVLRPGTPITSLPYTISTPGNYYLTKNLTGVASVDGITVAVNNATIDLGGFVLTGNGGTGKGINVNGAVNGTRITNGTIEQWAYGIAAYGSGYTTITDVQARSNSQGGIALSAHGSIEHCNASGNGLSNPTSGFGIHVAYATVQDCVVTDNHVYGVWTDANSDIGGIFARNNGPYDVRILGHSNTLHDSHLCGAVEFGDGGFTSTGDNVVIDNTLGEPYAYNNTGLPFFLPVVGAAIDPFTTPVPEWPHSNIEVPSC